MYPIPEPIQEELERQIRLWGVQEHSHFFWLGILIEELGEAAKAMLEANEAKFKEELTHVCAVALAWYDSLLRTGG